jgi:hypothetical protein
MDLQPRVQVVLGEAERTDGLLRFVLEGEGFDIIGLAADDRELTRVLRGARPAVIVLDGGISATAALEARRSCPGASLVVVWPDGVSAAVAEEHVEPDLVISDLGEAVRRADRRAELRKPPDPLPELLRLATTERPVPVPVRKAPVRSTASKPARTARRGSRILVAAATWMLVITALATIAVAVPKAFDRSPGQRAPRTSPGATVNQGPGETTEAPGRTGDTRQTATCDVSDARGGGAEGATGRGNTDRVRGEACPAAREGATSRAKGTTGVVKTIPRTEPIPVGATVPSAETPSVGQLDEVLDSLLDGTVPPSVVPTPGPDVTPISSSSAASLSAMPSSPLP